MGSTSNIIAPLVATGGSTVPGATVSGATSSAGSTSSGSGASNANSQLSLASNFNTFLNLLTTQLQNQDPTNPVDSNQFTQQLVEFAGVQQQVQANTTLSSILAAVQGNQVGSASSYIGTTIQATGDQTALTGGTASSGSGTAYGGTATIGYTLASTASNVAVTIKDSSGNVVFQGAGTGNSGQNTVTWKGDNSFTGATEPDGVYTVSVSASDSNGTAITATPFITGTVSSASISNGVVMLNIGGLQVPTTSVTSITGLPGASSSSGLASEIANLGSEVSAIPSDISSGISSALSGLGL